MTTTVTARIGNNNLGSINSLCIFAGSQEWRVNSVDEQLPQSYELNLTASPNPFNSALNLTFTQPHPSQATVAIYDLQGRQVAMLHEGRLITGDHRFIWDASGHPAGVYVVKAVSAGTSESRKVVLIR